MRSGEEAKALELWWRTSTVREASCWRYDTTDEEISDATSSEIRLPTTGTEEEGTLTTKRRIERHDQKSSSSSYYACRFAHHSFDNNMTTTTTGIPSRIEFYAPKAAHGVFSNFHVMKPKMSYRGKAYATSEHLYQAMKFLYDGASEYTLQYAELVRLTHTPYHAKLLGALKVITKGYKHQLALNDTITDALALGVKCDPLWQSAKKERMREVLWIKFRWNKTCFTALCSTGTSTLAEHTALDRYWGDGGEARDGANVLGQLLMETRDKLRPEEDANEDADVYFQSPPTSKRIKKN